MVRIETDFIIYEGVVVPESALRRAERGNRYGSVPGLDDEELADPEELERQVYLDEWGPVLQLPWRRAGGFRRELDEDGVEFGAFATVDFKRTLPEFDKARYKADRLREQLRDTLILMDTAKDRLPEAKYLVLKYLRMSIIERDHIVSEDMREMARLWLRASRFREEIQELEEAGRRKRERLAEMFA